ncbi:hypothetical protein K1719_015990 [Acacia pycnantha]|nr:hypothetical protein K1719_015990 [Acacia pycnantha]
MHHSTSSPSSELLTVEDLVVAMVLPSIFFSAFFFAASMVLPSSPLPFCLLSTLRSRAQQAIFNFKVKTTGQSVC